MIKLSLFILFVISSVLCQNVNLQLQSSINTFTFKLLHNTYIEQKKNNAGNFGLSPLSVWKLFSLLREGSIGNTAKELTRALNLPKEIEEVGILQGKLNDILKGHDDEVVLNAYSALYANNNYKINYGFMRFAQAYNMESYLYDKRNAAEFADRMNKIVSEEVQGKITDALSPEDFEESVMVLLDALFFKANWTYPFEESNTRQAPFFNDQGLRIGTVNMMMQQVPHNFIFAENLAARVLEMTYGVDKEYSMIIIVPDDNISLKEMLEKLATQPLDWLNKVQKIYEDYDEIDVVTFVPRFTISSDINLIDPLKKMGIVRSFDDSAAEFPKISSAPVYVSKAKQKVDIEVNEIGTVAAAITIEELGIRFAPPRFEVNKGFAFLVVNKRHNVVLFSGVYDTPMLV